MVSITLNKLGKKFNREWIFRDLNYEVPVAGKLAILGGNGSGKSTLLQIISGFVTPNEGEVSYHVQGVKTEPEKTRHLISFASPYLQLIEDFSLSEIAEHAAIFKPFVNRMTGAAFIDLLELKPAKDKAIKQFSSGMKQRLRLGLAILADTPVLLLDEPTSNLDKNAVGWYKNLINNYATNRTVIVCSNDISDEYFFCEKELNVMDYKKEPK